jgi:error-prone DNA polymerase
VSSSIGTGSPGCSLSRALRSGGPVPSSTSSLNQPFVHLHVHSNYSLREGAARVDELARAAAAMGMDALALTDHDGMYGAVRFTLACRDAGIRPILGAELEWGEGYHALLLAGDARGWANLCRLVTGMHLDERAQSLPPGKRPRTSFEAIAARSEGLVALSGCERGEIPWLVRTGRTEEAEAALRRWLDVFGTDRFAIEVSNHLLEEDPRRNEELHGLARSLGVRVAATNNVHYVEPGGAATHDVLDCIRRIVPLTPATAPRGNCEYWLKPTGQMAELHPPEALAGAREVADLCTYQLPLGEFHFPQLHTQESATSVLARRCWEGMRRRYPVVTPAMEDRLQFELRSIRQGGFCGYFLLVADIADHAKHRLGIRCACRGSAAGSLVAWCLGISDVDPIHHDLVFERFMNSHRREIPDIDIDFESARREEVLEYVLSTYGDRTAMVGMMETFRARAALREVGKALGLPQSEIDAIATAFPHISAASIPKALETLPELQGSGIKGAKLEVLLDLAVRLDSYPRHLALHPSGVILSDEALADLMPMQRSFAAAGRGGGYLMSQFDKDDVEALGIAKLDVLGVRMLSSIAHALDEIERVHGTRPDLDTIPRDDPATLELIGDSRTIGCFQIESPGQRELLGKFQPDRFDDLIIDISLFRPGPVKSDMVRPFLERRHRFAPVVYAHPSLAPILRETNGVIVYHEQVMRVIAALAGCDLAEADRIRRLLDEGVATLAQAGILDPLGEHIVACAAARGWDPEVAGKVWRDVAAFASFGFCKAHAAAFAVPTWQSAWLKAHHPAEFLSGVLTHEPGMYPRRAILADARAHGVEILGVDVNASWPDYRSEDGGIRLGLKDVDGISQTDISSIVGGRPWRSFRDFCLRAEVARPVVEGLVHCGAFDAIKGKRSRRELLWAVEETWSQRVRERADQMSFDLLTAEQIQLPGLSDYSDRERVDAELEVLGMDVTRHLISFYRPELERLGWTPASELRSKRGNVPIVVAGVKVATQTPPVRSGKRVIFLTLEDGTGQSDIALFEEVQAKYARCVFDGWILAVRGTLRRTGPKGVSILAEEVVDVVKFSRRKGGNATEQPPLPKLWWASPGSAGR